MILFMPGHSHSWGRGRPDLLAQCKGEGEDVAGQHQHESMDPTSEGVYQFLQDFFSEVGRVFPDEYLHLGGDEVNITCW